jgi:hypothetical protein
MSDKEMRGLAILGWIALVAGALWFMVHVKWHAQHTSEEYVKDARTFLDRLGISPPGEVVCAKRAFWGADCSAAVQGTPVMHLIR